MYRTLSMGSRVVASEPWLVDALEENCVTVVEMHTCMRDCVSVIAREAYTAGLGHRLLGRSACSRSHQVEGRNPSKSSI
jgi:formylmethanofuran dehydrogenase subunit E